MSRHRRRNRSLRRLAIVGGLGALIAAPTAQAATRYATQDGTGTACSQSAPCAVGDAISGAAAGDDVVVAPGDYAVTSGLKASSAITVEGTPGQPRPRLLGDASLAGDTLALSAGGTARHLEIHGSAPSGAALRLHSATGEDLVVFSTSKNGAAVTLKATDAGTLLRDTLAVCAGCGDGAVTIKDDQNDQGDGTAVAVAVTAVATGPAYAVNSSVQDGTASLIDVAASGDAGQDVDGAKASPVQASYSAFRAATSSDVADGGGNVGAPIFVDPAAGDYHQAATSPTLDAGTLDARAGTYDLDGNPRVIGAGPDIGAYEGVGSSAAGAATALGASPAPGGPLATPGSGAPDALSGPLTPAGRPVLGRSVAVAAAAGTVLVKLPGARHATALGDATPLPLGTEIDARQGTVRLTSAASAHGSQTGLFSGARFVVRQTAGPRPVTQLKLSGGDFSRCAAGSAARAARRGPSRELWGRDKGGHFSTIGRSASATVRGTRWLTSDTCAGTRVTVAEGVVAVRDRHRHRTVVVRAGHSYLVAAR